MDLWSKWLSTASSLFTVPGLVSDSLDWSLGFTSGGSGRQGRQDALTGNQPGWRLTRRQEQQGLSVPTQPADAIIAQALTIMEGRMARRDHVLNSPQAVKEYLRLRIADREHEVFVILFLDAQHRLIACEELFRGTLTQNSVYPREVLKAALRHWPNEPLAWVVAREPHSVTCCNRYVVITM